MKNFFKTYYAFTDYQTAQLQHLVKIFLSEFSKLIFLGIFFKNKLDIFLIGIGILLLLRTSTGGLHCKTYLSCFLFSFLFMSLSIQILPLININKMFRTVLLLFSILINYKAGPVISKIHVPLKPVYIKKGRFHASIIILFFLTLTRLIPENIYVITGFWIIILHTLQLIAAAKIRKKGIN